MEKQDNEEIEINLLELYGVLREKIVSILVTAVIFATLFGFGTLFLIEPKYESTAKLYIVSQTSGITSLTDLQVGSQLAQDYIVLVESRPVLEKVIENLSLRLTYEELLEMLTLNNPNDTHILEITVRTDDPYMAKEIVDETSKVSGERIAAIMNISEPTAVEYGHLEDSPCSPNVKKNIVYGALAGIFLSVAFIIVSYLLNDLICTEADIEKYLGLNTLGMIPVEEGTTRQMMIDKRKRGRWRFGAGNL